MPAPPHASPPSQSRSSTVVAADPVMTSRPETPSPPAIASEQASPAAIAAHLNEKGIVTEVSTTPFGRPRDIHFTSRYQTMEALLGEIQELQSCKIFQASMPKASISSSTAWRQPRSRSSAIPARPSTTSC
jgi:hypothetical protein